MGTPVVADLAMNSWASTSGCAWRDGVDARHAREQGLQSAASRFSMEAISARRAEAARSIWMASREGACWTHVLQPTRLSVFSSCRISRSATRFLWARRWRSFASRGAASCSRAAKRLPNHRTTGARPRSRGWPAGLCGTVEDRTPGGGGSCGCVAMRRDRDHEHMDLRLREPQQRSWSRRNGRTGEGSPERVGSTVELVTDPTLAASCSSRGGAVKCSREVVPGFCSRHQSPTGRTCRSVRERGVHPPGSVGRFRAPLVGPRPRPSRRRSRVARPRGALPDAPPPDGARRGARRLPARA